MCLLSTDPVADADPAIAFPQYVSDCASADPLADADPAIAVPQDVSDHTCKVQTPLLMLILPLPSLSM